MMARHDRTLGGPAQQLLVVSNFPELEVEGFTRQGKQELLDGM